ncbi:hypothetical protein QMK17_09990 [Rhodococcus sp. G-MC3]|uniref:hypothetical protein n=1 Tax=Rhodococcus sp. G-MC3 TaxID=3046209 RepID=UPI0024B897FB|nr:hypothetical protein [Rhodococcus sp. G-MC3]MDJ0393659.1 hypothetical protein [Rhodococcus sp. G-MC3]
MAVEGDGAAADPDRPVDLLLDADPALPAQSGALVDGKGLGPLLENNYVSKVFR